ncbi:RNA-dependent RNA polymerase 6 [Actinidia rufa]|uniref:RNA-dependent RNA polymerase n=1 Tax=Actinidia rufa TaxID=165716 RepID=A0A7J0FIY3_9ERIC|nr:RNA-dependent RNA polymerase 6 [Actinidia rufa]
MGELETSEKEMVVSQIGVGGFAPYVTAKMLVDFVEDNIGLKVKPHAFIHFAIPDSALDATKHGGLILGNQPLIISVGPENPYTMNQRRRDVDPYRLSNSDVKLEVGILASQDMFFVSWKGSNSEADFVVDPFNRSCTFLFSKDTAFSLKGTNKNAIIRYNFKIEFLVRDINVIRQYRDMSSLIIVMQLASSPSLFYRTADDDIAESVPFDLLDDEDPWIRTTDFTSSGAIGSVLDEPDFGKPMSEPFFCIQDREDIIFKVIFMLNAVVHKGIINQHELSSSFFNLLRSQPEEVNIAAFKRICSYRRPLFGADRQLKLVQCWLLRNPKLLKSPRQLDDAVEVRRLVITPTKAYFLPPTVELSNRVLRNYKEVADRFLRATFMDEGMQTLNTNAFNYYVAPIVKEITSNNFPQKTTIFERVKTILSKGFRLCGQRYSFLAFSSNQLRDRSAWFFVENKDISVFDIKNWMGKFTNRNVAKCTARMGQCFSSTYATVEVPSNEVDAELPDIEKGPYNFSDGIGKITPDLALEVAERLQLRYLPCAYQIRYAGCKGVIACWPGNNDGIRLSLRPSMIKFESNHTILEICSWTRFQPGFLNRQIVTLLSTLEVPDAVFWNMQQSMISKLERMVEDTDVAFDVLTASCAKQGNTAAIIEKARIFVPKGRWLMGCLDELAVLDQGQCFIQVSTPSLENCFVKHGSRFSEAKKNLKVIEGYVVVAKNPCLHPGDVQVLKAVDAPKLHHLFDCLVFPQKGDRPHTNEASGSDLDGDLYFVTWDENLIPPSKESWTPMDYAPPEVKLLPRAVSQKKYGNLGTICHAHVVQADLSDKGALDDKCIILAELAALAVDFPKTGKHVSMPPHLKPKMYPDFMGKEPYQSYKSKKILGRMYRKIKDAYDDDVEVSSDLTLVPGNIPYDADLEIPGSVDFIADAWNHKCSYDGQLNGLLGQYKVNREEEIVFEKMGSDFDHLSDEEKNRMYERKASAWYQITYHPYWVKESLEMQEPNGAGETMMLSFAWIATDYLARIKIRSRGFENLQPTKLIDSLERYLADRI